jgi:hypothetical protein
MVAAAAMQAGRTRRAALTPFPPLRPREGIVELRGTLWMRVTIRGPNCGPLDALHLVGRR